MPLWIEKQQAMAPILFVTDVLSQADEKAFLEKIKASLSLPVDYVGIHSQHWDAQSLVSFLKEHRPQFVVSFGENPNSILKSAYELEPLDSDQWQNVPELSLRLYLTSSPVDLHKSVEEKKNLWSALKKAKAQLENSSL